MKRAVIGILAHVDSGKTTLSEAILYETGTIEKQGRVDFGNAFLDTDEIEKDRGITIFSHQAVIKDKDAEYILLDTPGHVDFSAETERCLRVLDYAILVVSGTEGIQSHTETLWNLLELYNIPTFIFVNKMDISELGKEQLLADIKKKFGDGCVDFSLEGEEFFEETALCKKTLLEEYLEYGEIKNESLCSAVAERTVFPCRFGSALKNSGITELLDDIKRLTEEKKYPELFGARIFKISEDEKGKRLVFMKITGGKLKVKSLVKDEKVNEIRVYSGKKYNTLSEAEAGTVCAAVGPGSCFSGDGLGFEENAEELVTEPVFCYSVRLPEGVDVAVAYPLFKKLEEEETKLNVTLNNLEINVQIMGEIQLEVIKRIAAERFGMNIDFGAGSIIYKETIKGCAEGIGHYEPLRHYAEVHLIVEEGKRGSGMVVNSKCSEDVLDKNRQNLIKTHIAEKEHKGVLCGFPITDVKITVISGKDHKKHTEGGDFRQATYRAIRNALMQTESVILEPWYNFTLSLPTELTGRAMTDLQMKNAKISAPDIAGEMSIIKGSAPVSGIWDYQKEVTAYTRGRGKLVCDFAGYDECMQSDEVVARVGYSAEADTDNTADSVFCKNGAGFTVKWDEVAQYAHIPPIKMKQESQHTEVRRRTVLSADEEELLRIFENTYGKIKRKSIKPLRTQKEVIKKYKAKRKSAEVPEYLLIDGYNIIFAWDALKELAEESLEEARKLLIDKVCGYNAVRDKNIILVFDAYKVKGSVGAVENVHGITVVYTKEAETADSYIEKVTGELCPKYRVKVATSDSLEQMIIFGHGAERMTAAEFRFKIEEAEREIREFIDLL